MLPAQAHNELVQRVLAAASVAYHQFHTQTPLASGRPSFLQIHTSGNLEALRRVR